VDALARPMQRSLVIAGAGVAGASLTKQLRNAGFEGGIRMLSSEHWLPYDRPPLSKAALSDRSWLPAACRLRFDPDELEVQLDRGVHALRLEDDTLRTTEGPVPFDVLVIATGASAVNPWGDCVLTLRTIEDALRIKEELKPGRAVTIVGASWLGCEVASAAVENGCTTTVVEQAERPLCALPPRVGSRVESWLAEAGVDLRCGTRVESVEPGMIRLSAGEAVAADVVVAAVGAAANTSWLSESPLGQTQAVAVDDQLCTALPNVFAVGDVCSWPRHGSAASSAGHWATAQAGAQVLAAHLTGSAAPAPYVPYFWSECFGHLVQLSGPPDDTEYASYHERRTDRGGMLVTWRTQSGRQSVLGIDCRREFFLARREASLQ
jgi:3-phenylpropionate/trans-cinnamate dioxygenase ferredoxin reductase subunit